MMVAADVGLVPAVGARREPPEGVVDVAGVLVPIAPQDAGLEAGFSRAGENVGDQEEALLVEIAAGPE